MKLFYANLTGRIYWKICRDDPEYLQLNSLPGWFFVNPLMYPQIDLRHEISAHAVLVAGDAVVIDTDGIVIGTVEQQFDISVVPFDIEMPEMIKLNSSSEPGENPGDIVPVYSEYLATNLRQASKQVKLPTGCQFTVGTEVSELPSLEFPIIDSSSNAWLKKYLWATAVTWEHVIEADMSLVAAVTPVYDRLFLDAVHAYDEKDYRRTLLYSAISNETIAATKLEEKYEAAKQTNDPNSTLRIVRLPSADGFDIKDPIYDFLVSRGRFAELLHLLPLYLMNRSLLVENERLYRDAIELYKTRNKIAHLGEPPTREATTFGMNKEDARRALVCVLNVFEWFGNDTKFPLPDFGMIEGSSATLHRR